MRNTVKTERRKGIEEKNSAALLVSPVPSAWLHIKEVDECLHLSFHYIGGCIEKSCLC